MEVAMSKHLVLVDLSIKSTLIVSKVFTVAPWIKYVFLGGTDLCLNATTNKN